MKKIKLILVFFVMVTFLGCDQNDVPINTVFNGSQTLVAFQGATSTLAVTIDATGTVTVTIEASTASTSDRTVNVSIDESSTANPENYSLSSTSVTIPANEYFGSLTINGVDNSVETVAETIILNIDSTSFDSTINSTQHTVNIFQVCPIPSAFFTGDYLIEQTSALVDGFTLSSGSVVEVVSTGETSRSFETAAYPTYCSATFDFDINLVCNELIVPLQRTTCACATFDDFFGPAITAEMYDVNDDNIILLTFTDDVQSDCGTPAQTTYRFTKQ